MTFLWSAEPHLLFNGLGQYQGSIEIKAKPLLGWNHPDCGPELSPLYPVDFYRYDWRVSVIGQGQHFPKCVWEPVPHIITQWAAVEKALCGQISWENALVEQFKFMLQHAFG